MIRTYYIDENISWRVGRAVRLLLEATADIVIVQEAMPGIQDEDLLPQIGTASGVLITTDTRLSGRAQRDLILRNRVGAFFVDQIEIREQAVRLLRAWPSIERDAATLPRPFLRRIRQAGTTVDLKSR